MNPQSTTISGGRSARSRGSVLIVVMWITFGVISLAIYFSHSMELELRAADNQVASMQANQAIEAGALYVSNVLMMINEGKITSIPNMLPSSSLYQASSVKVGDGTFWLIGFDTNDSMASHRQTDPTFGLVDEASKINLNSKLGMNTTNLLNLPILYNNPTFSQNVVACIADWTSSNSTPSTGGAKNETYNALNPPYNCKNTNFETVQELSMVYNIGPSILFGEDANLNNALDPNENDGTALPPTDNMDGNLDPGLLTWLTVYSYEPTNINVWNNGTIINTTNRVDVTDLTSLTSFLTTNLSSSEATIVANLGGTAPTSVLDFVNRSKISQTDLQTIEPLLMNGTNLVGLINVNTASQAVLSCIPGIGYNGAPTVISYRQSNSGQLNSIYWLVQAMSSLGTAAMTEAGPYVTSRSFQFSADIAAVGAHGRGYRRVRFVFDCSTGMPQIVFRQDLTYLGWALGKKVHNQLLAGNF